MAFGLTASNGSNELTLSSDGLLLGYVGRAAFQSFVPNGTSTGESFAGYSTYTINWPGSIVVAIGLSAAGNLASLRGQYQTGTVWTIEVWNSGTTTDSLGFFNQIEATVYVWGLPTTLSGYGLAIYNAAGVLSGDLTRRPLVAVARVAMPDGVTSISTPAVSAPAIIGSPQRLTTLSTRPTGTFYVSRRQFGCWKWDPAAATQLSRTRFQQEYFQDDGGIPLQNLATATNALLIEAVDL